MRIFISLSLLSLNQEQKRALGKANEKRTDAHIVLFYANWEEGSVSCPRIICHGNLQPAIKPLTFQLAEDLLCLLNHNKAKRVQLFSRRDLCLFSRHKSRHMWIIMIILQIDGLNRELGTVLGWSPRPYVRWWRYVVGCGLWLSCGSKHKVCFLSQACCSSTPCFSVGAL